MSIIINGIRAISGRRSISPQRHMAQRNVSNLLNQDIGDIVELTKNSSKKQLSLLTVLASNFNRFNYYRKPEEKESVKLVGEIFGKIKKPTKLHEYICNNFSDSLAGLNKIFDWAGDDKKRLKFVAQLNQDIFKNEKPEGNTLVSDLLSSPYAERYMERYDEISSYLKLNKNKPDAISVLDERFAIENFEGERFDKALNNDRVRAAFPLLKNTVYNGESGLKLLTPQNQKLARMMSDIFSPTNEMLKNKNAEDIANILISTNKKNSALREELFKVLVPSIRREEMQASHNGQNENISLLAKLYNILDTDKNAQKFVKKSLSDISEKVQTAELVDILENVSTKRLNIFKDNAWNIISKTSGKERIDALNNNITDTFFETKFSRSRNRLDIKYGYKKRRSLFEAVVARAKNGINILRDAITTDAKKSGNTAQIEVLPKVELKSKTEVTPKIQVEPKVEAAAKLVSKIKHLPARIEAEPKIITELKALIAKLPSKQIEKTINKKAYTVPETAQISRAAKRQIVKEKVVSFVKTKLGEKTFNSQQADFSKKATQIRMSMLPEIFASIADTRKVDRLVGKKRSSSSNKDALELYLKINGHNKKFVNYMLKKRNVDNSRMFEIRDIIDILKKAENRINSNKKINSNYRPNDTKAYYKHLLDAKIEQYGKEENSRIYKHSK